MYNVKILYKDINFVGLLFPMIYCIIESHILCCAFPDVLPGRVYNVHM